MHLDQRDRCRRTALAGLPGGYAVRLAGFPMGCARAGARGPDRAAVGLRGGSAPPSLGPLLGSAAAAAAAVSALGLMLHAVEEGTENAALLVGLPVLACVGMTAVAIRQSRTERGQ